jgi:hypothetical protein
VGGVQLSSYDARIGYYLKICALTTEYSFWYSNPIAGAIRISYSTSNWCSTGNWCSTSNFNDTTGRIARLAISARLALCSTGTFNDATGRSQSLIPFLLSQSGLITY